MRLESYISVFILLIFVNSCSQDSENKRFDEGLSLDVSEKIYSGKFSPGSIKKIVIVKSSQRSFYPIPEWSSCKDDSVIIDSDEFFLDFKNSLLSSGSKSVGKEIEGMKRLYIFAIMKDGATGCISGFINKNGFYVGPMFQNDSYGRINNNLLELLALKMPVTEDQ